MRSVVMYVDIPVIIKVLMGLGVFLLGVICALVATLGFKMLELVERVTEHLRSMDDSKIASQNTLRKLVETTSSEKLYKNQTSVLKRDCKIDF